VATWQGYLREARRFWEVAQAIDAPGYHSQAVSNAVHAVIAANDAVCTFRIGERCQGASHTEAADVLRRACRGTALEQQATRRARQLADVLQQKSSAQYYGKQVDPETARRVMTQAQRFIEWVQEVLPQPEAERSQTDG
jgi:hypothetical protein